MGVILTILSAVLMTAANYYGHLYFLSWFAFLPFFYYIYIYSPEINYRKIFLRGWNLGFWILLLSANFLYYSIKLYTSAATITIILLLILLFLVLSLIYGLFFMLYFYLQQQLFAKRSLSAFFFAGCWTLFELVRHYLFFFFPIANPAYTQAEFLSFIQLADVGGTWLLTFILVFANGLIFQIIFQKKFKKAVILGFLLIFIFSFANYSEQSWGFSNNVDREKIEIGIITSEIAQQKKWSADQLQRNIELTLNAAPKLNRARLIIAPETNLTFDFEADHYYRQEFLARVAAELKTPIQIGSLASKDTGSGRYNSSYLISNKGKIISRYDKNLLLYFGETYPFIDLLNKYTSYSFSSLNAGEEKKIFEYQNLKWETVICSEILYPEYVRLNREEVDFIVNQTNEAWFRESQLLKNIMWQAAVFRAVENRIPVIKTGNKSYNGIIYPSGNYQRVDSRENYHILNLELQHVK
ncbi:apolipoprotein N-acyltransferase [Halanaerobium kushneri]|uniref:Apolipoprotein N-acyltransferase n=1 Tax=Halanaerobium kushneri TaxID=56779 RepID=A0A1N6SJ25_9FIRM|nr:apolipoprotein N-acyltransferase [Halanaerobium kushneri]SIQ41054.1 Apolipoprotein N-acyltransferase [Halanaerobium kushneri]